MSKQLLLTEEQRKMYAAEKLNNFRWISKLVATYSNYTLTSVDLVPEALYQELAELGEFSTWDLPTYSMLISYQANFPK